MKCEKAEIKQNLYITIWKLKKVNSVWECQKCSNNYTQWAEIGTIKCNLGKGIFQKLLINYNLKYLLTIYIVT